MSSRCIDRALRAFGCAAGVVFLLVATSSPAHAQASGLGEAVSAIVIPRPGATLTAAEIVAHCRQQLAGFKCPKRVIFAETLPKNAVGKVLKRHLVEVYGDEAAPPTPEGQ